jgi:hypothetical protein
VSSEMPQKSPRSPSKSDLDDMPTIDVMEATMRPT